MLGLSSTVFAQGTLIPFAPLTFVDANGNPLSGGKLCTYAAGTTTPQATYSAETLSVGNLNANPVIMAPNGRPTSGGIFLSPTSYKFVFREPGTTSDCTTGTILWTLDGIRAVPTTSGNVDVTGTAGEALTAGQMAYISNGDGGLTNGRWYKTDADLAYASSNATIIAAVTADIASGAEGTFRLLGTVTGLSGLTAGNPYYVSGTAGALTATAPTNRRIVGQADSTTTLVIDNLFAPQVAEQTTTLTGAQNDFVLTDVASIILRANNATTLTLSGFASGGTQRTIQIIAMGAGQVTLVNQATSSAPNQIITGLGANLTLQAGTGRATLVYDITTARWRVTAFQAGSTNVILEGVSFPATQVPSTGVNVLDDYEEGTWTPVIGGSGGTSGQVYAFQIGHYIKIGKLVYISCYVELSTEGTITTNAQIQGLPFTIENIAGLRGGATQVRFNNLVTNWVNVVAIGSQNSTVLNLTGATAAGTSNNTALTAADIGNTTVIEFVGMFQASQ